MKTKNENYRAALYCRLSRDDGDKSESDSIVNQQRLMEDFCARRPELTAVSVYADDGFTGTNFRRPDFKRMLDDIEGGKINCVIVKDLSRFGRDYIDIGFYLERLFPAKGVRFIAINDGIDSRRGPYDMMLPLKNVFNAQYAKDTSEKVRKSFRARQRRGEFISAFPPYGYRKDPENKNHLVVDRDAAVTVRYIFEQKAKGAANRDIARLLNQNGVLSPIEYKRSMGVRLNVNQKHKGTCYWSDSAVKRILANEMYLGNMVSNRYPSDEMHGRHRSAPRSEWIVVEGTHEPIIPQKLWDAVQKATAAKAAKTEREPGRAGLFSGFVRCGDCGCALVRKGGSGRSYFCSAYRAYGEFACSKHAISEDALAEVVLTDVNRTVSQVKGIEKLAMGAFPKGGGSQTEREARGVDAMAARIRRQKQAAYEDYRAKRMTREEYMRRKEGYDRQEQALKKQLKQTNGGAGPAAAPEPAWVKNLIRMGRLEELDRLVLEQTVREIRVFEDRRIEVEYLFSEELRAVIETRPQPSGAGV